MPSTWDAYVAGSPLGQTLDSPYYKGTGTAWGNTIVVSSGRRALPSWIIWLQAYQTFYVGDDPFATFAVSFGYPINPANADQRRVENIWANGRLIWSGSATSSGDGADIDWTFYPGSEAQGQDPLMAADLAESAERPMSRRSPMRKFSRTFRSRSPPRISATAPTTARSVLAPPRPRPPCAP